ncbi:Hydantoinase B/oxoprolinase [compost metagenome]
MNPVKVIAPEGSVVNPHLPAPCGHATACTGAEIAEAVLLAISKCAPKRVGVNAHKLPLAYTSGQYEDGRPWVNLNFFGYTGGAGGAYQTDGWGLYPPVMTGVILPSIEMNELQYPSRVLKHEYTADFTGAGQWRGTPGLHVKIQHLEPSRTSVMMAGVRNTTRGLCGGADAPSNLVIVDAEAQEPLEVRETAFHVPMSGGGIIEFQRAGGGGWGDPYARDPELVLMDVRNGFVTIHGALRDYGVSVEAEGMDYIINSGATAKIRQGGNL